MYTDALTRCSMANWKDQLREAEERLKKNDLRNAFLVAFGALEICSRAAQKLEVQAAKSADDLFNNTLRTLKDRRMITNDEFNLARHLGQARNVVTHKYGFEPSQAEVQKTISE